MRNRQLDRFGLKWNPFNPSIPIEACHISPQVEQFLWKIENLSRSGGFALVTGESGTGKSVALRLLQNHLRKNPELTVAIITRPQGSISDFYRELGTLFGVQLSPHNRWAGAKELREQWRTHIEGSLFRSVLIIDEAQEMHSAVLSELRLLCSDKLDSRSLLTVVLCGDDRLPEKFRSRELMPLGTRIRSRVIMEHIRPAELGEYLRYLMNEASNPALMTKEVQTTLCERAAGNLRILMNMSNDLLDAAIRNQADQIDEKLFLELFSPLIKSGTRQKTVPGKHQ